MMNRQEAVLERTCSHVSWTKMIWTLLRPGEVNANAAHMTALQGGRGKRQSAQPGTGNCPIFAPSAHRPARCISLRDLQPRIWGRRVKRVRDENEEKDP
jgi:hypothetical protein